MKGALVTSVFTRRIVSSLVLLALSLPVWGQSTSTGTVSGQVTDPTNAVVVGASVALVDTHTGTSRTATTNEAGRYVFVNVAPGTYDIKVTKAGFSQAVINGQTPSPESDD